MVRLHVRKRQALICESCGFDPFLYKQDIHLARKSLRKHWETKIENEKLFSNLKLKNYETARVKAGEAQGAFSSENSEKTKTNEDARA